MSEQIARAVSAETTAQANRIEQMFGQMMAAQASSTTLLTKESNQDKKVTPPGTTAVPALPAPDVYEQRRRAMPWHFVRHVVLCMTQAIEDGRGCPCGNKRELRAAVGQVGAAHAAGGPVQLRAAPLGPSGARGHQ
jgi:hypothetical protein